MVKAKTPPPPPLEYFETKGNKAGKGNAKGKHEGKGKGEAKGKGEGWYYGTGHWKSQGWQGKGHAVEEVGKEKPERKRG